MQRIALYRKYRSADFDEVIGQDHVTRSLSAALARELVSHAYLFTGPRGTGKTSVARILARRVNGLERDTDLAGQLDVIEIDAASNRGIDEIRQLRERIVSAPSSLKYKVYIIDEVHMLTREAFNALLKTLEEPPAHAILILATTDAHKLPETILSRVQRFDFRSLSVNDLIEQLRSIAKQENITIDDEALELVARSAGGGSRDAISLLDQLSVIDGAIDQKLVLAMLGLSSEQAIDQLLNNLSVGDLAAAIQNLSKILDGGADPQALTSQIVERLRQHFLLVAGIAAEASDAESDNLELTASQTMSYIESFSRALQDFKLTQQYSLPIELALYRLVTVEDMPVATPTPTPEPKTQSKPIVQESPKTVPDTTSDSGDPYTKALSYIKTKNNSLYAVMNMADVQIEDDQLRLGFNFSFHKDRVEEMRNRALIEAVMSRAYGRPIHLICQLNHVKTAKIDPDSELVTTALEILGGEVID